MSKYELPIDKEFIPKSCPFCGRKSLVVNTTEYRSFVECNNCKARGPKCESSHDVVLAQLNWNSRNDNE